MVFVTWALVAYLICTPSALKLQGLHIRQTTHVHVTYTIYTHTYIHTYIPIQWRI